jgi:hypothetical protein
VTGVTLQLTPWQVSELRGYAHGHPVGGRRPSRNLIRRGFLELVAPGRGYQITSLGLAALERAQ